MQTLIAQIESVGIMFIEEEIIAVYLRVHINCHKDGTIHLIQGGLTEKIVEAIHLSN